MSSAMYPRLLGAMIVLLVATAASRAGEPAAPAGGVFGLVIHGGAGTLNPSTVTPEQERVYREDLTKARDAGYAVLERGGTALDAVVAVITCLEDSPHFNAGKGAVMNADGVCELDSSIMDGRTRAAGAVAGVRRIRNPIVLARAVMEKSEHVMLVGDGAEAFAREQGFDFVPNEYFHTERARRGLERARERERAAPKKSARQDAVEAAEKFGTVGCVALDKAGNLAAGTSTGGRTNKRFGRVGDSPIIGAGTYAHNATCAVSATGWGEFFIRAAVAHDISAQMEHRGRPLAEAAQAAIDQVAALGGDGGVIAIDRRGNIALPFNTDGMLRGYRLSDGRAAVQVFRAERR